MLFRSNMLAEVTTTTLSRQERPATFEASKDVAKRGGKVANTAKEEYERTTGVKAVSSLNASDKPALEIQASKSEDDE